MSLAKALTMQLGHMATVFTGPTCGCSYVISSCPVPSTWHSSTYNIYITLILLRFLKAPRQFCLNCRRTALIQLAKEMFETFENVDEVSELATANEKS